MIHNYYYNYVGQAMYPVSHVACSHAQLETFAIQDLKKNVRCIVYKQNFKKYMRIRS